MGFRDFLGSVFPCCASTNVNQDVDRAQTPSSDDFVIDEPEKPEVESNQHFEAFYGKKRNKLTWSVLANAGSDEYIGRSKEIMGKMESMAVALMKSDNVMDTERIGCHKKSTMAENIKLKSKNGHNKRSCSLPRGRNYHFTEEIVSETEVKVESGSAMSLARSKSEDNLASLLIVRHLELEKKKSKILSPELREYLITEYIVEIEYDDSDGHMKNTLMRILPEDVDEDTIFDIAPGLYKKFLDEEWRKMSELVRLDEQREGREAAQPYRNRVHRS